MDKISQERLYNLIIFLDLDAVISSKEMVIPEIPEPDPEWLKAKEKLENDLKRIRQDPRYFQKIEYWVNLNYTFINNPADIYDEGYRVLIMDAVEILIAEEEYNTVQMAGQFIDGYREFGLYDPKRRQYVDYAKNRL